MSTAAGLAIALGWPFVTMIVRHGRLEYLSDVRSDVRVLASEWSLTVLLVLIVAFWERRPASSVGMRKPSWPDFRAMGLTIFAMYAASTIVATVIVLALHSQPAEMRTTLAGAALLPLWLKLAIPITAGVCEEFMFRGYALERLIELTGSPAFAAVATIGLFTFAHVPRYGLGPGLIIVAVIAVALTLLYLWRRNLPVNMLMHAIIDGLGVLFVK